MMRPPCPAPCPLLPICINLKVKRYQTASAHAHQDMCEVFFVQSGAGIIRINGQKYPLLPGNCIAVEPGEVHEVINNSATELVLTYFGLQVGVGE